MALLFLVVLSCSSVEEHPAEPPAPPARVAMADSVRMLLDVYRIHRDTPLKILAIGNSFTHNAATYLPMMVHALNADSVCVAKLTRSGCSLSMHWQSHLADSEDYDFHYSAGGAWHLAPVKTIDAALRLFHWDLIVIQQQSGLSGVYLSYYPLDDLIELFRDANPNARLAWHCTWPYRDGTDHGDFARYDWDPKKMYDAIMAVGHLVTQRFDISIPSATLIWEMRKAYPEVENQFSDDGYHISDPLALYALSTLWYECLVRPAAGTSSLPPSSYPDGVDPARLERAVAVIRSLLPADPDDPDPDSVPMIHD